MNAGQPKDAGTGRFVPSVPDGREPDARLLTAMRAVARRAARNVWNDPRLIAHVDRCVLTWLMGWNPDGMTGLRPHIAFAAGNEARRVQAMDEGDRRRYYGRSHDLLKLCKRVRPVR